MDIHTLWTKVKAIATAAFMPLEAKFLKGASAAYHQFISIFGPEVFAELEKDLLDVPAKVAAGEDASQIIKEASDKALADLKPEAIAAGRNALKTAAGLILASTIPTPAPTATEALAATTAPVNS